VAVSGPRDTGRLAGWATAIGLFSALSYWARFGSGSEPVEDPLYRWSSAVTGAIQFGFFLGFILLLARGRSLRDVLALRRPTSWGLAARISGVVIVVIWLLALAIRPFLDPSEEQGLIPEGWDPSRAAPFAANFVVVALVAPAVEELLFRGIGFTLLSPLGRAVAILGTAVAWALSHGLVEGFPTLVVFGVGLAYLRSRTESILPCFVLHAAFNTFVLLAAVDFFTQPAGAALALLRTV
jgi:membrane protease YdiL (CAAX protease family)